MKSRLFSAIVIVALIASASVNLYLWWRNVEMYTELRHTRQQIAVFQRDEATRRANEQEIFLWDPNGFVANRLVLPGEIAQKQGPNTYRIVGNPWLKSETQNKLVELEVREGETVNLMTYRSVGQPEQLAYYVCYTNSAHCVFEPVLTGILTGN